MPYPKRNNNYRVDDVRNPYATGIASASLQLISGILIHPDDPYKARIVGWRPNLYPHTNYSTPFHDEDFILKMMDFAEKDLAEFSTSSQERLQPLMDQFPVFVLGILLCPNGKWCLEQIDELVPFPGAGNQVVDFPWVVNSYPAGHPPIPSAIRPPDAENSLWHLPDIAPSTTSTLRTSTRPQNEDPRPGVTDTSKSFKYSAPKHFKPKDNRPAPS